MGKDEIPKGQEKNPEQQAQPAKQHDQHIMELLKEEPLTGHPVYERVASLGGSPSQLPFSQVAKHRPTGELVAIKFVPRGWDETASANCERTAVNHMELSISSHPHITEFKAVFLTPHYLAIVTEYVEGETMESFLEKIGGRVIEGLARFILQQLIIAVDFCHQNNKILRDIKLSNTLLVISEGQLPIVKLWDFSSTKDLERDSDMQSLAGTFLFAAPEVLQNFGGQGKAADIWACGIILYIMLFGRHPFLRDEDASRSQEQRMLAMLQRTICGDAEYPSEIASGLSPACMDLLMQMITADPQRRITMQQIRMHPWFLEALPDGAVYMNEVFVRQSHRLAPAEIAQFKAMVKKASVDDHECTLPTEPVHGSTGDPAHTSKMVPGLNSSSLTSGTATSSNDSATMMPPPQPSPKQNATDHSATTNSAGGRGNANEAALTLSLQPPGSRPPPGDSTAVPSAGAVTLQADAVCEGNSGPGPVSVPVSVPQPQASEFEDLTLSQLFQPRLTDPLALLPEPSEDLFAQALQLAGPRSTDQPMQVSRPTSNDNAILMSKPSEDLIAVALQLASASDQAMQISRPLSTNQPMLASGPSEDLIAVAMQFMRASNAPRPLSTCDSGLVNLDDAVMNMPSIKLLQAATEDGVSCGRMPPVESLPSTASPRTNSELERALMASSSFMREFMAAKARGLVSSDNSGVSKPGSSGSAPHGSGPPSITDQMAAFDRAFSYDASSDLARAACSLADDFDWKSFNEIFSRDASWEADQAQLQQQQQQQHAAASAAITGAASIGDGNDPPRLPSIIASPENSSWARICNDVKSRKKQGSDQGQQESAVGDARPKPSVIRHHDSALIHMYRDLSATLSGASKLSVTKVSNAAADAAAFLQARLSRHEH